MTYSSTMLRLIVAWEGLVHRDPLAHLLSSQLSHHLRFSAGPVCQMRYQARPLHHVVRMVLGYVHLRCQNRISAEIARALQGMSATAKLLVLGQCECLGFCYSALHQLLGISEVPSWVAWVMAAQHG